MIAIHEKSSPVGTPATGRVAVGDDASVPADPAPGPAADPGGGRFDRVLRAGRRRVDGRSLAALRIAVGAVAVLAAVRTWAYGWVDTLYAGPTHHFSYYGFGWVPRPGALGMRLLLAAVALAGTALVAGWRTRWAAGALAASFAWVELIDATTYLNHYWFVTLVAVLCAVAPSGARWSLDARRLGPRDVAAGWVWLLRFQVGVVYSFAGLAKLQHDWLVEALPLKLWLPARAHLPLVGDWLRRPVAAHVLSVAGAVYDCTIVALLLWRRSRPLAWLAVVAFHVSTWVLFPIGVFPWLMICASTVFFDPDWPGRVLGRLRARRPWRPASGAGRADRAEHGVGRTERRLATAGHGSGPAPDAPGRLAALRRRAVLAFAVVWVLAQVAIPLRRFAYPGDHRWSGQGYRFGWNVLLVERTGSITFLVTDPATGDRWAAEVDELYTLAQLRVMSGEPDLIRQAAHAVADAEAEAGRPGVEVRVDAWMSFNGRPARRWIDPTVDLAAEPASLAPAHWILPADHEG